MKKSLKIVGLAAVVVFLLVAGAGMYKFNYLADQPGRDVDGNLFACDEGLSRAENEAAAAAQGMPEEEFGITYCLEYGATKR